MKLFLLTRPLTNKGACDIIHKKRKQGNLPGASFVF